MSTDPWAAPSELHAFLSYQFITEADKALRDVQDLTGLRVLELGSGSGSQAMHELGATVTSVEHDEAYVLKYPDVNYIHAPIVNGWYDTKVLREQLPAHYDVVVVDGPPGAIGRGGLFSNLDLFDTSKPFIFDDVHRPAEQELLFKVARYLGKPYSIHVLVDGRAFGSIGVDLW